MRLKFAVLQNKCGVSRQVNTINISALNENLVLFDTYAENSFVIPNFSEDYFDRTKNTNIKEERRLGLVGNFRTPKKNLAANIEAGLKCNVEKIVIWGDVDERHSEERLVYMGYGHNKFEIQASYDVFLSLSKEENLPLAVIQALSAGKPCVLSNIEAHRVFSPCRGVRLVDVDNYEEVVRSINKMVTEIETLEGECYQFWLDNFSQDVIGEKWEVKLEEVTKAGVL